MKQATIKIKDVGAIVYAFTNIDAVMGNVESIAAAPNDEANIRHLLYENTTPMYTYGGLMIMAQHYAYYDLVAKILCDAFGDANVDIPKIDIADHTKMH